jgi:hypothetical protein
MTCFVCRKPTTAHIIKALQSSEGPKGWGRICIPCAIAHDLDGVLLATPGDAALANAWIAHRRQRDAGR